MRNTFFTALASADKVIFFGGSQPSANRLSRWATIDFVLSAKRDTLAAKRFLAKALGGVNHPHLWVINIDRCKGAEVRGVG